MRLFVYIILFVLALIVFKAFYLDSMQDANLSETNASVEMNTSAETAQTESAAVQTTPPAVSEGNISGMSEPKKVKPKPEYKGMPLEKVGDEIADKLEGKF